MAARTSAQSAAVARVLGDAATVAAQHKKNAPESLAKSAARAILRPYAETDNTLAARVTSLTPYVVDKGMSARQIVAAVEATVPAGDIPTGFTVASISRAASVTRLMADTANPLPADLSKTARDGIAAALMRIVARESDTAIGGGTDGMARALTAAVDGTTNGAEIADRLTAEAVAVTERSAASRREKKSVAQPVRNAGGTTASNTTPAAKTPAPAAPAQTPTATPAQIARNLETGVMLGELLRRFGATDAVVTPATLALFDQVAQTLENAHVSSGTPAAKTAAQKRQATLTAAATRAARAAKPAGKPTPEAAPTLV